MTAVSLLSSDTVFLQPYREEEKRKAGQAHRRFASKEGDLLTLINIYEAWMKVIEYQCNFIPYSIILCFILSCLILLSSTIFHHVMVCHTMLYYIIFCYTLSSSIMLSYVML